MRNTLAIARKEISVYFTTPWAYVALAVMMVFTARLFASSLADFKQVHEMARLYSWARLPPDYAVFKNLTDGVVVQLWNVIVFVTALITPVLSMRLYAEERKQKTLELLMTAPVRPIEIVLGKYLGGVFTVGATLGLTILFPLLLSALGSSESGSAVEWSTVLTGYLGMLLWGATCMAVGSVISSFTESQVLAGFITLITLLFWAILRSLIRDAEEPLRSIVSHMSAGEQLQNMMKGVVDLKAIVFFASVILLSLFLTHRVVEGQRWA